MLWGVHSQVRVVASHRSPAVVESFLFHASMTSKRPKHDRSEQTKDARKITDFFCPVSSRSSNNNTKVVSESTSNASPETRNMREDPVPVRKSNRLPRPTLKAESYRTASSKRTRSPEVSPRTRKKKTSANKDQARAKRQKKFESDLDISMDDVGPVIHVKSPKQREHVENASQDVKTRFESIPTSQSDEIELDATRSIHKNSQERSKCVEEWCSDVLSDEIQIQDPDTQPSSSPLFSAMSTPSSTLSDPFHGTDANDSHSTPDTPPVPERLSPVPLDEEAKTAQLIEKIKAEAQVKVQRFHDSPPLQFNDVLDSSSDEDEVLFSVSLDTRGKRKSREPDRERPYAFKKSGKLTQSLSPSMRRIPLPPTGTSNGKRPSAPFNPLDALLLEKRRLDKAGKGAQAFIRAESMLQLTRASEEADFDNEYASDRWLDEDAAQNVVREVQSNGFRESDLMDLSLDGEQAAKLIGANGGKVADILKRDQANEEQGTHPFNACGLRLWMTSTHCPGERIQQDRQTHSFQYCGVNPVVNLLKVALEQQDYLQANLILESGVLSEVDLNDCEDLLSFLCKEAFSYPSCTIQSPAYVALSSVYAKYNSNVPPFTIAWLLGVFADLGADPSVLELMGYDCCSIGERTHIDVHLREGAMLRLVYLLRIAGQSQRVADNDIPDFVIAMQRVFLDVTTSSELRTGVMRLVDILCNLATPETERLICEKAIFFNMALEMPYKAQFASVLSSGSGTTRRIAKWVAFSTLISQTFSFEDFSGDVPPLQELLHIVEAYDIFQMKDEVDYAMLWYSVQMLGIALTDVELYDAAERSAPQSQQAEQGSPNKGKSKSMIILIHESLEWLHAEIEDTRALRLDRSRAKAAIKQLSLRLRYQHSDSARNRAFQSGIRRRKTLDHFFTPKKGQ